jgi:hypothetical protein
MLLGVVGVDVNARGYQGASGCSHTAVLYRNREALIQFIQHGADVDQTKPMMMVCRRWTLRVPLARGSSSISCLLRAARADTDVTICRAKIALRNVAGRDPQAQRHRRFRYGTDEQASALQIGF